jgi:uncharacterized membrane protein YfhO
VIRTAFDPGWRAAIDGEPARVLVADAFLQAVAVPTGTHEVVLRYEDPWVMRSLLMGALAWLMLAVTWLASALTARAAGISPTRDAEAPPR